jgi:hypothetical protein
MYRWVASALVTCWASGICFAAPHDLPVTDAIYAIGRAQLEVKSIKDVQGRDAFRFSVSSHGTSPAKLVASPVESWSADRAYPSLSYIEMDNSNKTPEFLIQWFTGGAHCCVEVHILDLVGKSWTTVAAGTFDGDKVVTSDAAGDGESVLIEGDDRFLYKFSCYACAPSPTRYLRLVQGLLLDVSASPAYRQGELAELADLKKGCEQGDNGFCASFIYVAQRLGLRSRAWQFMLEHYDKSSDWGLDEDGKAPGTGQKKVAYPEALDAFLKNLN